MESLFCFVTLPSAYHHIGRSPHVTPSQQKKVVRMLCPVFLGVFFKKKVPEWTPNVQLYKKDEYLRVNDAERCDVRGSLAVPVLDRYSGTCVAVIELVMMLEKIEYRAEIEGLARALQEVNLSSTVSQACLPLQVQSES
ncbi:hypothetical protein KP509_01G040700 [Ceratopteris richardii]|uniref:Uncharacterized protein n=1 Tax=Ceratopteris richardii TaxID=49495 RepID=A0A8T2VJ55_CERRI|nr:hypothetical protein KP509_01G040700 [Ceratopteris richardii]